MIPIANNHQMRECDRITIEQLGLPGMVLMENASRAVAENAIEMLGGMGPGSRVIVFCGKGNNGGDGFAVARYLLSAGADIIVYLLGDQESLSGDAALNCQLFKRLGGVLRGVKHNKDLPASDIYCDLIVDGLLGTGFKGKTRGLYADAIKNINSIKAPVISIDIPSGVNGDDGQVEGVAIIADRTVTFGLIKCGLLFSPGRELTGKLVTADIGIPTQVVEDRKIDCCLIDADDVKQTIPLRHPSAHKGDVGHVYILAGSPGMTGAAALCAEGAMRCGAGLTAVGTPASLNSVMETKLTEAMTHPLPNTKDGNLSSAGLSQIAERLDWADVLAIGPGLGLHDETAELLKGVLKIVKTPIVIDADALNILAKHPNLLDNLPANCVLTPHPGEFTRLTGISVKELFNNRTKIVAEAASKWNATVVLKGSPTISASLEGKTFINPTGNAGMATGGTGDVLTGVIAGLIAQGVQPVAAAWTGAYLHGKAGDRAADEMGQHGLIASDIVDCLPAVIGECYET